MMRYLLSVILIITVLPGCKQSGKELVELDAQLLSAASGLSRQEICTERYVRKQIIERCISEGANVNAKDVKGTTALMYASQSGEDDLVKFFVLKGANVNARDDSGQTALSLACKNEKLKIVKYLITKGADVETIVHVDNFAGSARTVMDWAAQSGHADIVKLLIRKGAYVGGYYGAAALSIAASWHHKEIIKLLIAEGADVNSLYHGRTAMMSAIESHFNDDTGCREIINELVLKGASTDIRNGDGQTALMLAIEKEFIETAKLLIARGADVSASDNHGKSVKDYAYGMRESVKTAQVVEWIKSRGSEGMEK